MKRTPSKPSPLWRAAHAAVALCALSAAALAQTATHKKAAPPPPKPEPTEPELVEYIRGSLLALSPADGMDDNLDVRYDPTTKVLTVDTPNGHCDFFIAALNANQAVWDVYDPSDTNRTREKVLRLTLVSVSGKAARACYDQANHVDPTMLTNRARFLFSQPKADEEPDFQDHMAKAFKKLIALAGGAPEKELF